MTGRRGATARRSEGRTSLIGSFHRARARREEDGGFTIVETVITMAIVTAILGIVLGVVTNIFQQSQNVKDTVSGVQQDQTAGQALTQYLHSATDILAGSNATTLEASIYAGITSTDTPQISQLAAVLTNSASVHQDGLFTITLTPKGGTASTVNTYDVVNSLTVANVSTVAGSPTLTVASGGFPNVLSGMLVTGTGIGPATTVLGIAGNTITMSANATASGTVTLTFGSGGFTYYYNNYSTTPVSLSSTTTPGSGGVQYSEIVAIGIDVEFLAGPNIPTEGFEADRPSNFETTVYLQNSSGQPAPATATALAASGTIATGQPLNVTATVTATGAIPDGGTVSFTVTNPSGNVVSSACSQPVYLNTSTGTAICTFTPTVNGTYTVAGTYSGTSDFQPSSGSASIPVTTTTATSLSVSGSGSGSNATLSITATVTASNGATPTGSVAFKLSGGSGCSPTACTTTVSLGSGGTASWSKSGLSTFNSYSLTANFNDPTNTYQPSSASWSGNP